MQDLIDSMPDCIHRDGSLVALAPSNTVAPLDVVIPRLARYEENQLCVDVALIVHTSATGGCSNEDETSIVAAEIVDILLVGNDGFDCWLFLQVMAIDAEGNRSLGNRSIF